MGDGVMHEKIAVTGMGLICPLGLSVRDSLAAALAGKSGIRRCDDRLGPFGAQIPCRVAGLVDGFEASRFVDRKWAARHDLATMYAIAAADEAIADAALPPHLASERMGCVIGSAVPGGASYQRFHEPAYVENLAHEIPAYAAMAISGNMPSGLISLRHRLAGPNAGIVNACASGATAIHVAADAIRLGRADVMIAGGTEAAVTLLIFASFANAGGMISTSEPEGASRPFSRDRAGFVNAEGAGVVVLEGLEHARARGARIHAILAGYSSTNDAFHVIRPREDGESWRRTMELALIDAQLSAGDVDAISAHATSTPAGDLAEARAIKALLGERASRVPVSATKSMHGHAFGAAGAIEIVLALAAMNAGVVLPTINHTADPECDIDCVPNVARKHGARVLLKNSFGFGGTNASLVFQRGAG